MKIISFLIVMILLGGMLVTTLDIQRVKAQGIVYIRADGSIDPPTAPISTLDNFTYTFGDSIYEQVLVQRNNTIIDGNGHLVQGNSGGQGERGINLTCVSNVTIKNANIQNFYVGIFLSASSDCRIIQNNLVANTGFGIGLDARSSNNLVSENNVADNLNGGIGLFGSGFNNAVSMNNVANNGGYGVSNAECINTTIYGNDIIGNNRGIELAGGMVPGYNLVDGNYVASNTVGIWMWIYHTCNNVISRNNIVNNSQAGVVAAQLVGGSPNNTFCYNDFVNNTKQVIFTEPVHSFKWDNGYPSGGNYWSDYNGSDLYSGYSQNEAASDGIGDTEYTIDENNIDKYPLMGMFSEFNWTNIAAPEQRIQTICNSTMSNPVYAGTAISFDVTGENGTSGFCRICIPEVFMNGTFQVFVNGTQTSYTTVYANSTHNYIYFTYNHSTQEIVIVPEFQALIVLPILMIAAMLAVLVRNRRTSKIALLSSVDGAMALAHPARFVIVPKKEKRPRSLEHAQS